MSKPIHIVFEVLNFLGDPISHEYKLLDNEKLILIFLSRFNGPKGIFPSVTTLSDVLQKHRTSIHKSLNSLSKKGLLKIIKTMGKSNRYVLSIPCPTSSVDATSDLSTTSSVGATPLVASVLHTSSVGATLYNISNNPIKQREESTPTFIDLKKSPPVDNFTIKTFVPDVQNIQFAQELGVDLEKELNSFKDKFDGKPTQGQFKHWLIKAHEYMNRPSAINLKVETKSTAKFWGAGHPDWERLKNRKG